MKFGIALASEVDSWRWVVRAEELGFSSAWFYDTQMLNPDVFVCMALAADRTERIRLGTGVVVPSNRIEPVWKFWASDLATRPRFPSACCAAASARPALGTAQPSPWNPTSCCPCRRPTSEWAHCRHRGYNVTQRPPQTESRQKMPK